MFKSKKKREKRHQEIVDKLMALWDRGDYYKAHPIELEVEIDRIFWQ